MTTPTALSATHAAAFAPARGWSATELARLLDQPQTLLIGDEQAFVLARWVVDEAEILTLATHPAQQRKGLARAALTALERRLPPQVTHIFLEVAHDNLPARTLYQAAGYKQAGQRPKYYPRETGHAADALILRKLLQSA